MDKTIYDNIDINVNPGENFYKYATGKWIDNNPQPEEYPSWNTFIKLADINIKRINDIITSSENNTKLSKLIHDYYNIIMNYDKRNEDGVLPVQKFIINNIYRNNCETNNDIIDNALKNKFDLFFSTYLCPDSKGSGKYEVYISQGGLGLGNKDYYLNDTEDNKRIIEAYKNFIINVYEAYGYTQEDAIKNMQIIYDNDVKLANVSYSLEQLQNPVLTYNRISVRELIRKTKFNWDKYLKLYGYDDTEFVIVDNLDFYITACDMLKNMEYEKLETIYKWCIMLIGVTKTSDILYDISFKFNQIFTGATVQLPKWKRAVSAVNNMFYDIIGQIYVKKYFDESSKYNVIHIIKQLKDVFYDIIESQEWMSDKTKNIALKKLDNMDYKIGYPDKWIDYSDIELNTDLSYFENYLNIHLYMNKKDIDLHYNKNIDKDEWHMPVQSVNAYYDPINNEICFPAGILQYPFYDQYMNKEQKLGAIGTIIGHEMTHAFDNNGRYYDENGCLNDWWSENDTKMFNELTKTTEDRFNNIEVLEGLHCNGTLTLGENLADFGGIKLAYNVCKKYICNFDIDKQNTFFIAYANNYAGVDEPDVSIRNSIMNDEHSIPEVRVNGTLPMFNEWYNTYNVKESGKLFVPVDKRAKIW